MDSSDSGEEAILASSYKEIIKSRAFNSVTRNEVSLLKFPLNSPIGPYRLHLEIDTSLISDVSSLSVIPSETTCQEMIGVLKNSMYEGFSNHLGGFTCETLELLLDIHELVKISEHVKKEKSWLKKNIRAPDIDDSQISTSETLGKFSELILNHSNGDVILGENILAGDAAELTHNFWLPVSIITNISALLHHQNREVGVFYLNEFMTYSELEQRDTIAKQNYNLKSVVFLISVGYEATNKGMEVFFITPKKEGCHWSVLHIEFQGNKWTYCDTLGWETPVNLKSKVDSVLRIFVEELNVPVKPMHGIKKAHSFNMNTSNEHECNKYCLPNIPLQTCQNVCGVISVIMASLCVVSPHVWSCLISSDCTLPPEELHWLKHPTTYSDYLRTVLISWLINNEVNLENLGISQEVLAMEQAKKLSPCSFVKKDRKPMFIPRTLDTQSVSNTPYSKETKESSRATERKVKQASPDVIKDSSSPPVSSFKNPGSNKLPNSSAESNSNTTSVIILKSVKIGVSGKVCKTK